MNLFRLRSLLGLSLALVFSLLVVAAASAATLNPEKPTVRAAYVSNAGVYAALWVAAEKGYFKEYGLTVEPLLTRSVTGIQALISGSVQFVHSACPQFMTARKGGSDVIILSAAAPYNLYTVVSRAEITEPKQLVGKKVAINQLGDTTHLSVRFALQQLGVNPDAVTYVQIGGTPERLAALQSGSVDAALQAAQSLEIVKTLGMNVLINLLEQKLPYCGAGIGVTKAFMTANPQTTEAFLRGIVKGNAFAREGNADQVKAIMAKYMRTTVTNKGLVESYNFFPKKVLSKYPGIPTQGLAFIINEFAFRDHSWSALKPELFYDSSIIEKLKNEGFLEEVYKQIR